MDTVNGSQEKTASFQGMPWLVAMDTWTCSTDTFAGSHGHGCYWYIDYQWIHVFNQSLGKRLAARKAIFGFRLKESWVQKD